MHRFDYSIPQFSTHVWGIRMVVTLDIVFEVLYVPRVRSEERRVGKECLE